MSECVDEQDIAQQEGGRTQPYALGETSRAGSIGSNLDKDDARMACLDFSVGGSVAGPQQWMTGYCTSGCTVRWQSRWYLSL